MKDPFALAWLLPCSSCKKQRQTLVLDQLNALDSDVSKNRSGNLDCMFITDRMIVFLFYCSYHTYSYSSVWGSKMPSKMSTKRCMYFPKPELMSLYVLYCNLTLIVKNIFYIIGSGSHIFWEKKVYWTVYCVSLILICSSIFHKSKG